jgi:hypothetical protein
MKTEERYCSSCREPLPAGAAWCEKCGADAGDVFDGRMPRKQSTRRGWIVALLLIAAAAVAVFLYRDDIPIPRLLRASPKFDTGPVGVVGQRPGGARRAAGAKLSEPEAVRTLRKYIAAHEEIGLKSECVAVAGRGFHEGAYDFDVIDSCRATRVGRWRVDGRTGEVGR